MLDVEKYRMSPHFGMDLPSNDLLIWLGNVLFNHQIFRSRENVKIKSCFELYVHWGIHDYDTLCEKASDFERFAIPFLDVEEQLMIGRSIKLLTKPSLQFQPRYLNPLTLFHPNAVLEDDFDHLMSEISFNASDTQILKEEIIGIDYLGLMRYKADTNPNVTSHSLLPLGKEKLTRLHNAICFMDSEMSCHLGERMMNFRFAEMNEKITQDYDFQGHPLRIQFHGVEINYFG